MKKENPKITTGVTLLRKLTHKSVLGFGRHAQTPIQNLILEGKLEYLTWIYYFNSNITFTDEILEALHCKRIAKPGKDEELFKDWKEKSEHVQLPLNSQSYFSKRNRRMKLKRYEDRTHWSKGQMAWYNQHK